MGGGWNWLRIMSNGGGISSVELKGSAGRDFKGKEGTGQERSTVFSYRKYP